MSQSSEINLKEQIKNLMYVNRVEVRATCIRSYQGDWYTGLGTPLAPETFFLSCIYAKNPTKIPVTDLTLVKLQAHCFTHLKLHTLHTYHYISIMTKTELLLKYFSKILLKFSENLFCRTSLHHRFPSSFDSLKHQSFGLMVKYRQTDSNLGSC